MNKNLIDKSDGLAPGKKMSLQLYVSGMSQKSMNAIENIKQICDEHLKDCFDLEIIDIYKNPEKTLQNQVVFSPSLIRNLPLPKKTLVGTFTDTNKVITALGITNKNSDAT